MNVRWGDGGGFGCVPVWVLKATLPDGKRIGDKAIRLYVVLAAEVCNPERAMEVTLKWLAEEMGCATSTVKLAIAELESIGAMTVEQRTLANGARSENAYTLHCFPPTARNRPTPADPSADPPADPSADNARAILVGEPKTEKDLPAAAPQTKFSKEEINLVWDALVKATGFDPSASTEQERRDFGKSVKQIRAVIPQDATSGEIEVAMAARRRAWDREYPDARLTHRVMRGKWAEIGALAGANGATHAAADVLPGPLTPEMFRAWRSTASREAIAEYQHRYDVDDNGEPLDGGF